MIVKSSRENITKAGRTIQNGGIVAFPTETVYGLGANALDSDAVASIYQAKKRPATNPLIVHIPETKHLFDVVDKQLSSFQEASIDKLSQFWPGPLSIVLPKGSNIPKIVSAGQETIAIRIPKHRIALALLRSAERPIAAPSANRSNYVSPTHAQHVQDCLGNNVDIILDGGLCQVGIESTVLSLIDDIPVLLRPGSITKEQLEKALDVEIVMKKTTPQDVDTAKLSPGRLEHHYSPSTPLALSTQIEKTQLPSKYGAIVFGQKDHESEYIKNARRISYLSSHGDLTVAGSNLYAALRTLDKEELDMIIIESCDDSGIGYALMDRISRATTRE